MSNEPDYQDDGYNAGEDAEQLPPSDAPLALLELPSLFPELSKREVEVALGIVHGLSSHEIAAELGISTKTYDTHRGHLLKKLMLKNVVQLTLLAVKRGAVTP